MGHKHEEIALVNLQLSLENPRLDVAENQKDSIDLMIEDQGDKLINLAKHIVEQGINPSDALLVTKAGADTGFFRVLEGNRRVTVLKLLSNPGLIPEGKEGFLKKIRPFVDTFAEKPIEKLRCVVFDTEEEAHPWMQLKHTGENEGIGTAKWDAQQVARFKRKTEKGYFSPALQVIDFLTSYKDSDESLKKSIGALKITNLERFINDRQVRDKFGFDIDFENQKITSNLPEEGLFKSMSSIVRKLSSVTVKEIYNRSKREEFVNSSFSASDFPEKADGGTHSEIGNTPSEAEHGAAGKTPGAKAPNPSDRKYLISKDFNVKISSRRIGDICKELRILEIAKYSNAVSILLRVFIELSVDDYGIKNKVAGFHIDLELNKKLDKVCDHLEKEKILTKHKLKPVRVAACSPHNPHSTNTLNAYVHNVDFIPDIATLKSTFDNFQPFLQTILA